MSDREHEAEQDINDPVTDDPMTDDPVTDDPVINEEDAAGVDRATMSPDWRRVARQGKNDWWRYVLGIFLFLFCFLLVGGIGTGMVLSVSLLAGGVPVEELTVALKNFLMRPSIAAFVANNISFVFGVLGLMVVLPVLHRRPFLSLLGARLGFRWPPFLASFGLWFAMLSILGMLGYALEPNEFIVTFNPRLWTSLLLVTIPLTFIQVSCEELFFRGYLLQGLGLLIRSKIVLAVLGAIPFAVVHFWNPEMDRGLGWMASYYLAFGIVANWLTLKENRLELALGFHLAINYFGILIISSTDSVLPAPSIFTVDATGSPMWSVLVFLVEFVIFYGLFFKWRRRRRA